MSRHHRTAGVSHKTVEINGVKYKLRPITVGAYAEMEAFIVSRRPDPLDIASAAVARLPKSQHDAIWRVAMDRAITARTVTQEDAEAFENSVDGLSWKLWQCLKDNHPEINSLDAARDLLIAAGEDNFQKLAMSVQVASGEADLGKSTGQAEAEAEAAGQPSTDH